MFYLFHNFYDFAIFFFYLIFRDPSLMNVKLLLNRKRRILMIIHSFLNILVRLKAQPDAIKEGSRFLIFFQKNVFNFVCYKILYFYFFFFLLFPSLIQIIALWMALEWFQYFFPFFLLFPTLSQMVYTIYCQIVYRHFFYKLNFISCLSKFLLNYLFVVVVDVTFFFFLGNFISRLNG